jgi:hypothetical protein
MPNSQMKLYVLDGYKCRVKHTITLKPFYSKLAGLLDRLVTMFVKHFHYLELHLLRCIVIVG